MRKIVLSIALAFAFALPVAGTANAQTAGIYKIHDLIDYNAVGNTVPLFWEPIHTWASRDLARDRKQVYNENKACDLRLGTLVDVIHFGWEGKRENANDGSAKVRVLNGPCRGKVGFMLHYPFTGDKGVPEFRVRTASNWPADRVPVFYAHHHVHAAREDVNEGISAEDFNLQYKEYIACSIPMDTKLKYLSRLDSSSIYVEVKGKECKGWIDRLTTTIPNL